MNKAGVVILGAAALVGYYFFSQKKEDAAADVKVDEFGNPIITNPDGTRQAELPDGTIFTGQGPAQPGTWAYELVDWLATIPGTTQADIDIYVSPWMQGRWLSAWVVYMRDFYLAGNVPVRLDPTQGTASMPYDVLTIMQRYPSLQRFGGLPK
jgi:hypothetical protein